MDHLRAKKSRHVVFPSKIAAMFTRDKHEATTTATSVTIVKCVSLCDTQIRVVIRCSARITSQNRKRHNVIPR